MIKRYMRKLYQIYKYQHESMHDMFLQMVHYRENAFKSAHLFKNRSVILEDILIFLMRLLIVGPS